MITIGCSAFPETGGSRIGGDRGTSRKQLLGTRCSRRIGGPVSPEAGAASGPPQCGRRFISEGPLEVFLRRRCETVRFLRLAATLLRWAGSGPYGEARLLDRIRPKLLCGVFSSAEPVFHFA